MAPAGRLCSPALIGGLTIPYERTRIEPVVGTSIANPEELPNAQSRDGSPARAEILRALPAPNGFRNCDRHDKICTHINDFPHALSWRLSTGIWISRIARSEWDRSSKYKRLGWTRVSRRCRQRLIATGGMCTRPHSSRNRSRRGEEESATANRNTSVTTRNV